jgi:hypothetical protein
MRYHLDQGGLGRVLLAEYIRARTIAREKLAQLPLENGQEAINVGLKLQGQMKGLDLAIDIIFDLANWAAMQEMQDERPND